MDHKLFVSPYIFWKVKNSFFESGAESPTFYFYRAQWKLKLLPASKSNIAQSSHNDKGCFEVHLILAGVPVNYPDISFSVICNWEISNKLIAGGDTVRFNVSSLKSGENNVIFTGNTKRDFRALRHIFPADCLYFVCLIKPDERLENILELREIQYPAISLPSADSLARDLEKALYHSEHTDVVLKCGDKSIPAHKAVLSCRSEVFQAMFQNEYKESKEGVVDITDIGSSIFEHLIHYLYTGTFIERSMESTCNLYKAAHLYNIQSLKMRCVRYMKENLDPLQACEILLMADLYNENDLKSYVMSYIANRKKFLLGEEWLKFSKEHPLLAQEVFFFFVERAEIKYSLV